MLFPNIRKWFARAGRNAVVRDELKRLGKRFEIDPEKIEFGFELGGVSYYKFKAEGDMPAGRYMEFTVKYEEMRMGVNREFMEKITGDMLDCFNPKATGKNAGIMDMNRLHECVLEIKARLSMAPIGDDIYAYLSVIFFPLDEDVARYDPARNAEKIKAWKAMPPPDFFLMNPIGKLINFQSFSAEAIQSYLTEQQKKLTIFQRESGNTSMKDSPT